MSLWRSALVLGTLSMVGPFAIDMYLPAMPDIARDLGVGETEIQTTVTAYFLAFGIAQMVYGPWADQSGRKLPVMAGLCIFLIGSAGAALADTASSLTFWRFLQGLGGAVLMVVPRAVVRDLHTGAEATRLMALIMLVISVSPMLAPLAGSILMAFSEWRVIFVFLFVLALSGMGMCAFMLPETLPPAQRTPINVKTLMSGSLVLLRDSRFMGLTLIGAFSLASFFVFLASAAFVYTGQFGLSPMGFSLAFAINAVGFFSASQLAGPLAARMGLSPVIRLGTAIFAGSSLILLVITLLTDVTLPVLVGFLFIGNAGLGLVVPTTMVMALEDHGDIAGLASSLGGTIQMVMGGLMILAGGPFFDGTALPMVVIIALCSVLAFGLAMSMHRDPVMV